MKVPRKTANQRGFSPGASCVKARKRFNENKCQFSNVPKMMQELRYPRSLFFLAIAALSVQLLLAQSPVPPAFDVAAIHENLSDPHARSHIVSNSHDGKLTVNNVPLKMLLAFAFGVPESHISDLPSPLSTQKFDIEAKSDASIDAQLAKLDNDQAKLQKQLMLQALLADRFKLTWHNETRQLPIYHLIEAKGGAKLQEAPRPAGEPTTPATDNSTIRESPSPSSPINSRSN